MSRRSCFLAAAEGGGVRAIMVAKEMAEMAAAVETHGHGDAFHPQSRSLEQTVCKVETNPSNKFHRSHIERRFELSREGGAAHSGFLRQTVERVGLSRTIEDCGNRPAET